MATYPSCISASQLCTFCYASQSCTTCANRNSDGNPCANYCNSGCNTRCDTAQTFCNLGVQTINNHTDVPNFPAGCLVKDELIFRSWTATFWNTLRTQLTNASKLGLVKKQGTIPASTAAVADPCNDVHPANSLITAEKYNQVIAMLNFFNQNLPKVNQFDVIRASHALALQTGYNSGTFNKDVCDVCNVGNENRNSCNCSCACSCSCTCACSCSCACPGCDCSCSNSGRS